MRIKSKVLESGDIELTVTATADEVDEPFNIAVIQLAMQSSVDPISHEDLAAAVKEKVDEAFFNSFIENQLMIALAPLAVNEKRLDIVMEPRVHSLGDTPEKGKEFSFKAEVTLKPFFTLSSYDPVTIEVPSTEMTEEEIDEQIAAMAESYAVYEPREDGDAGAGGGGADAGGAGAGGAGGGDVGGDAGGGGDPRYRKVVPAITDEWIRDNVPAAGSLQRFRELLREQGEQLKKRELENMATYLTVVELAKRFEGTIPDELYQYTHNDMMRNLETELKQKKSSLQEYLNQQGMDEQTFSLQMMMQAREVITQGLSLDALARHKGFVVEENDIDAVFHIMAPDHAKEAREQYEKSGRMYFIRENALRHKTNQWLVENATVKVVAAP
jgi:trigger factor